ncbi:MAG: hypothetical protein CVV22_06095 [Ignavibacteriae bacterium HGW-Ignavibacteriae-1]|jgi:putative ABC transport system substrate-binding protein|nr:MAG: hypothetical protein CVV22_06095 [Ignavibacteriae bacterium HGW-Ignavibacteriae-1]
MDVIMKIYFVFLIILASVLINACNKKDGKLYIGIVQISEDPALDQARLGVIKSLEDAGYRDGENIKIDYKNAQSEIGNIVQILSAFEMANADMIITNSTPCMVAAAQKIKNIPVVATVTFSPEQAGMTSSPANLAGVYDPFKIVEFVDLVLSFVPDLQIVGLPYSISEPNAQFSANQLIKEFTRRNIKVIDLPVYNSNDIAQAIQTIVSKDAQVIIASADNTVYLGLPYISKIAGEKKIPVFVTDPLQVEKGAAIGFGVDYDFWGLESGKIAAEILSGKKTTDFGMKPIVKYTFYINKKTAQEQGLSIPDSLLSKADRVF